MMYPMSFNVVNKKSVVDMPMHSVGLTLSYSFL